MLQMILSLYVPVHDAKLTQKKSVEKPKWNTSIMQQGNDTNEVYGNTFNVHDIWLNFLQTFYLT